MQTEYYVSKGEQTLGPWTLDEIVAKMGAGEVTLTDFLYDDVKSDWVALLECSALREKLNKGKPKAPPQKTIAPVPVAHPQVAVVKKEKESAAPSVEEEWFVQKGDHRFGPFSYLGIVKALQEKTVFEFDLVWKAGMELWMRIAELEEFRVERIRELQTVAAREPSTAAAFIKRQHPRIAFDGEVIVHDNKSVWMGRAFEGSAGGSGLVIENATLVPGQTLLLHFASREGLPAFNALCEIVSKKYSKDIRDTKSPVNYGVRFLRLDSSVEPQIQGYFAARSSAGRSVS